MKEKINNIQEEKERLEALKEKCDNIQKELRRIEKRAKKALEESIILNEKLKKKGYR